MRKIKTILALCAFTAPFCAAAVAATDYPIEAASNDEKFVINGNGYTAKTYCIGWEKGDLVSFSKGDPFGGCASAKLYNRRTKATCDVLCD